MENMENIKLVKKIFIRGKIIAETGLHIGSKDTGLSIGNTDNTVIRHPITQEPYIPGSSLRGKMRTLLERSKGLIKRNPVGKEVQYGPYVANPDNIVCKVFGVPAEKAKADEKNNKDGSIPSRLIVRDGKLLNAKELRDAPNTDMPFTEVKTEVVIDRVTSAANPRQLERVPSGAEFELELVLNLWSTDTQEENDFVALLTNGLELLQDDYLGGHGSRGSGKVSFKITSWMERTAEDYENDNPAKELPEKIPARFKIGNSAHENV